MAKTRMTTHYRDLARNTLMRHATTKLALELVKEERDLVDLSIREILGSDFSKLAKTPQSWLKSTGNFTVGASGWYVQLHCWVDPATMATSPSLSSDGSIRCDTEAKMLPRFFERYGAVEKLIQNEKLIERLQTFSQKRDKEISEIAGRIHSKIGAAVGAYSNVEALLTDMPELIELEPRLTVKAAVTAVAVTAKTLMCDIAMLRGEERDGCCADAPSELVAA